MDTPATWAEQFVLKELKRMGITVGDRGADIRVFDKRAYLQILLSGSLGLGETYMNGWWDAEDIPDVIKRMLLAGGGRRWYVRLGRARDVLRARLRNCQKDRGAFEVGERHYDLGAVFPHMLGHTFQYSCGYWGHTALLGREARSLDEAQTTKLRMIAEKLMLEKGTRVLDVGCGWGTLLKYLKEEYGVLGDGLTVSREQALYARELHAGLPIDIFLKPYEMHSASPYDRIVSVGAFEHFGHKNYRRFMEFAHRHLVEDGVFLLHTIGLNETKYACDPWFHRYIFPNGELPSMPQIGKSVEGLFVIEDWHNFGCDYALTLRAWYENFIRNWSVIRREGEYDEQFFRMFKYYLLALAGAFESRTNMQLWQIVLRKPAARGPYRRPAL